METQGIHNSQMFLKTDNKVDGFTFTNFKTYYKAAEIKTVLYWYKDRYIYQQERIESPEMNLHTYSQPISTRMPRPFNGVKYGLFNKQ